MTGSPAPRGAAATPAAQATPAAETTSAKQGTSATEPTPDTKSQPATARLRRRRLPGAWLGYAYATAVGFVWGSIWSTGAVERANGLWVFRGMPKWTFGRGGSCVGGCYLTDTNVTPAVLRHERVHQEQWRTYGLALPVLYFFAGRNPLRNRFEIEAGLRDGGYVRS